LGKREDAMYGKWLGWLARIDADLTHLALERWTFQSVSAMTRTADLPPSFVFEVLSDWYVRTQAIGVRRQTEIRRNVASLARLLDQVAKYPEVLTRARYVSLAPDDEYLRILAGREYDRVAGEGSDTIEPNCPRAAIERLQWAAKPVRRYVNRIVAHQDHRPTSVPTADDLNAAVDTIEKEFIEWSGWLTGQQRLFMTPVPQYDWLAPFRVPWLRPETVDALPPPLREPSTKRCAPGCASPAPTRPHDAPDPHS